MLKLTSNTVFKRPIFAPWYRPTWCSHKLMIRTSDEAKENKADLRSKSCNVFEKWAPQNMTFTRLVFSSFSPVSAFNVHDHNVHALSFAHPNA